MRAAPSSSAQRTASSNCIPASWAAWSREMPVPRIAAAQAKRVASMPSPSRRATSPRPRAERFRARSSAAEASTGSSPLSCTLARSSTVSYGLPPVTAHTSRQNGASACSPSVARVSPVVASGVSALSVTTGRAAAATASSRRARSPLTSPGLRATTTRTGRSSRRSANAASHCRVSWSAQCASSRTRTRGHSRLASRRTAATSPSHTPCGSAWRSPGSAMPSAGPAMSYQSPR